jgi:Lactoylglutathione lyase and related lyases
MKINHTHHIAINTRDFEASIKFYKEILKMQFIDKVDLGEDYVAYLKYAEDSFIELFKMDGKLIEGELEGNLVGLKHIAFDVDNLMEWNAYLKDAGIKFILDVTEVGPIRKRVLLIEAPDNVIVELCENY